jgi:CRP/FNR family transcriptional regulator, cyclic AMP receptor protein
VIPQEFERVARAYRLLGDLEPKHLRKLVPLAEDRQFRPGEIIFKERDRSSFLYLIVSGEVALEMRAGGAMIGLQKLQAGDAMGWSALTEDGETHFQARAVTPVSTVAFPSHGIREACEGDPEMGYALMKRLLELVTERLDAARMQIVRVRHDAEVAQQA